MRVLLRFDVNQTKVIFVMPRTVYAMRVTVRAFGSLIPLLGDVLTLDLEEGSKISVLKRLLSERLGRGVLEEPGGSQELLGEGEALLILLNGRNIETLERDETELRDGDVVILLPPFAGG